MEHKHLRAQGRGLLLHNERLQAAGCHKQASGLMTVQSYHTRRTSPRQATVKERRATEMLVVPAAFMSRVSCMVRNLSAAPPRSTKGGAHRLLPLPAQIVPLKGGS